MVRKLRSPIFNGVTVEAPAETEDTLVKSPRAAQAWRSHKIQLMPNVEMSHFVDGLEATNYSVHGMTGVDRQHAEGILGKGVKIAVVDTGVDYNHPAVSASSLEVKCLPNCYSSAVGLGPDTKSLVVMTLWAMAVCIHFC